ncbi:SusC/RagA family TonB-linked outer membrane protein [Macellibacteroides fermentans]|uniref:TonB-linked SusC/RagA family outer membrane protein n=2 Tax=Macellibacteroides TaxID=1159323 RepID=A0A8E2A2G9_9PORP|nr:TonB-dependent receptor [Macellibacteroides fermentans]NYI50350.1 TonB-linked SusC/RagA family outer membrane protein [Macellibacteroides fermentans]
MRNLLVIVFLWCTAFSVFAQDIQIKGVVVSGGDNLPLPGVNVVVKGTSIGTITDLDGQFSFAVPAKSMLSITYIGYKPLEVAADGSKLMNITLQEDTETLDEVVVVGYGVQKKSVVTAAISRVTAEDLNNTTPSRIEDALKGKVSGVQITQSSGQPGADSKVRIRGVGTVNNSEPLYIVDGMPVDGGINYLNPTDIQSVEILKDAASAAIYGARAANGVILVTTKSGVSGKTNITYDFTYGLQNPWKKRSVLNATEYMTLMNEVAVNDGNAPKYLPEQIASAGKGTDWQDETFNYDAPVQSHQVSVNGGSDKIVYFLSLGYFDQEGIVGGNYGKSNYNRWSLRTNSTYNVFETKDRSFLNKMRVGVNISYARAKSSGIETNSEYGSILGSALAFDPTVPVYATNPESVLASYPHAVKDKDGKVYTIPAGGFQEIANPVGMLNAPTSSTLNEDKFVASFWGELDLYEGLKFKSSYGADLAFWGNDGYTFPYFLATQGKNITQSSVFSNMHRGFTWQVENTLTYTKTFDDKHNLTVLLGQSAKEYTLRELYGDDFDLLETNPDKANINSAIADRDEERVAGGTGGFSNQTLASYFGRIDYNFDERYMIQATVRRDGSSNFGPNHKWAVFPSVSLGWNVTNEAFMDSRPDWFSNLKLRASWGKNGNERIGQFRYTSLMDGGQNYYFGSGDHATMQYGSSPSKIANPDVKWEESEQLDLGFESRFFNNSLTFGFDYFKKNTNGMLMDQPIPAYVGKGAPIANAGDMQNWGLEFESTYKLKINDFSFNVGANASYLNNKLIKLGNASGEAIYADAGASGVGSYVKGRNGEVYPYFYGYKTGGILQNQQQADEYNSKYGEKAQPGDVIFLDIAGEKSNTPDGKITDADKTKIGKGMPDWTFGLSLGADWKGFDLNLFFQGTAGNDVFDFSQRGDIQAMNRPSWMLDRWIGEGTSNKIPRMTAVNPNRNWRSSDLYIKDGSYVRLKTIQLGYSLPTSLLEKASLQRLRLFVTAENLFTFTSYDGFDPEIAAGDYFNIGVDKGIYPQSRTISVGANLTF